MRWKYIENKEGWDPQVQVHQLGGLPMRWCRWCMVAWSWHDGHMTLEGLHILRPWGCVMTMVLAAPLDVTGWGHGTGQVWSELIIVSHGVLREVIGVNLKEMMWRWVNSLSSGTNCDTFLVIVFSFEDTPVWAFILLQQLSLRAWPNAHSWHVSLVILTFLLFTPGWKNPSLTLPSSPHPQHGTSKAPIQPITP